MGTCKTRQTTPGSPKALTIQWRTAIPRLLADRPGERRGLRSCARCWEEVTALIEHPPYLPPSGLGSGWKESPEAELPVMADMPRSHRWTSVRRAVGERRR